MYEYGYGSDIGSFYAMMESAVEPNYTSYIISIVGYVFLAMGLYAIAKRRGIQRPWLAWIPIANAWLLGCISDQYRYIVRHEEKNKRKILLTLEILMLAVCAVLIAIVVMMVPDLVEIIDSNETLTANVASDATVSRIMQRLGGVGIAALVLMVLAIAQAVVMYMAYYDLFASCDPNNKTIYLVLGILFGQLMSFFVFACRKKDFGMPPRRDEMGFQPPQSGMWTPPQQTWQPHQPPVEPWEQNRE